MSVVLYTTLSYLSIFYLILWYIVYEVIYMKPLKTKISITIDEDLLEKLKIEAEKDERPLSQYINVVLRKHIDFKK